MSKIKKVDIFYNSVKDLGFFPKRCNEYHVQVRIIHNFYPIIRKYYNSLTGKKRNYSDTILTDKNEFSEFLNDNMK